MIKFHIILIIIIFTKCSLQVDDYKIHPCLRECNKNTNRMICEYEWKIEWYSVLSKACLDCPYNLTNCNRKDCISANGVNRPVIAVNKMIPGPSIIVCQHDVIKIKLKNNLHSSEGTSIHWHGLKQKSTPYMDGVSMISQCPIIAHSTFEYQFFANEYGTHFWHAHSGLQRADGAFGPLIVRERDNPNTNIYDSDLTEHIITINDWINDTSIAKFSSHHHNDGDNSASSILINGKGALKQFDNRVFTPRALFSVEYGKKYRFRLINAGVLECPIEFSIDNHNLTIIASDGNYVEPYEVESLVIYAGERFDFILDTHNKKIMNYWIKAKGYSACSSNKAFEIAVLNYNPSEKNLTPTYANYIYENASRNGLQLNPWNTKINRENSNLFTSVDKLKAIDDDNHIRNIHAQINTKNIKKYYIGLEFSRIENPEFNNINDYSLKMINDSNRQPVFTSQINNISMIMPSIPILYKWNIIPEKSKCNILNKNEKCPNNSFCSCIHTYEFNLGDVIEFVIVDEEPLFDSNHPMHLHGHSFAVLAIEKINQTIRMDDIIEMDNNNKIYRNFYKPPIKDTVTVPVGGYTIIRFVADNPGTWMFHCHLDFHSEIGMSFLIKVGNLNELPKEPPNWPQCGDFIIKDSIEFTNHSNSIRMKLNFFVFYLILFVNLISEVIFVL